jgi:hypothetical protein
MHQLYSQCFPVLFVQYFLHEMSQIDEKVDYLVKMGFPEDEVNMAVTRCGMLSLTSVCLRFFSKTSNFFLETMFLRLISNLETTQGRMHLFLFWLIQSMPRKQQVVTLAILLTMRCLLV